MPDETPTSEPAPRLQPRPPTASRCGCIWPSRPGLQPSGRSGRALIGHAASFATSLSGRARSLRPGHLHVRRVKAAEIVPDHLPFQRRHASGARGGSARWKSGAWATIPGPNASGAGADRGRDGMILGAQVTSWSRPVFTS